MGKSSPPPVGPLLQCASPTANILCTTIHKVPRWWVRKRATLNCQLNTWWYCLPGGDGHALTKDSGTFDPLTFPYLCPEGGAGWTSLNATQFSPPVEGSSNYGAGCGKETHHGVMVRDCTTCELRLQAPGHAQLFYSISHKNRKSKIKLLRIKTHALAHVS